MATQPIDYAALAAQARSGSPKVDYAALAAQARQGEASTPQQPASQGFLGSASDSSGLSLLGHVLAHPIDSAKAVAGTMLLPGADQAKAAEVGLTNGSDNPIIGSVLQQAHDAADHVRQAYAAAKAGNTAGAISHAVSAIPVLGPVLDKAQDQYADKNYSGEAGTLTGLAASALAPKVAESAAKVAPRVVTPFADAAQAKAADLINHTIGAGKNDFKHGANPGAGYFQARLGPSATLASIAEKAGDAKAAVGAGLGPKIAAADASGVVLPPEELAKTLQGPISKARGIVEGPGGTGNTGQLEDYSASFRPALQNAVANGGATPSQVFDLKKSIAANTTWNDPAQFNLNKVRQVNAGQLSGLLKEAVPELSDDFSAYQNLGKLADRAGYRAQTGSPALAEIGRKAVLGALGSAAGTVAGHGIGGALTGATALGLDSVPFKTSLASGLYYGGEALPTAAPAAIRTLSGVPPAAVFLGSKRKKPSTVPDN